ncbi:MAG: hypothetical protein KDC38_21595, partial [Planctomycetes bacterium]|nr:hypothetical protein [Planctomycetota bacterium]
ELDCNANGIPDSCDIADGTEQDCNANGIPDSCDIASGTSLDDDMNGIPDECSTAPQFRRGDCNTDGGMDISDAIFLLSELFSGGPSGSCADSCDANDDGGKDIGDAIYILATLFSGGPNPPAPFGACGEDPTADGLDCASYPSCP